MNKIVSILQHDEGVTLLQQNPLRRRAMSQPDALHLLYRTVETMEQDFPPEGNRSPVQSRLIKDVQLAISLLERGK